MYNDEPSGRLSIFKRNVIENFITILISGIPVNPSVGHLGGDSYCGFEILLGIILVVIVIAISCYDKLYLQFQGLNTQKVKKVAVTRDGRTRSLPTGDLLVGEVVHLTAGDEVPADGIYISGYNLLVDQSSIKGTSTGPVNVNQDNPFILAGTVVQDGSGKMLVVAVGMRTYKGRLITDSRRNGENDIATKVRRISLVPSLLVFFAKTVELAVSKTLSEEFTVVKFVSCLSASVSNLSVGGALSATLNHCIAAKSLMKNQFVLRNLSSCETIPAVSIICSDKTGTLTTNQMVVHTLFLCDQVLSGEDAAEVLKKSASNERVLDILLQSLLLNTCSEIVEHSNRKKTRLGNPTELSLLEFGLSTGGEKVDSYHKFEKLKDWPFNSLSKRRSMLVACPGRMNRAFCTGAAEIVLQSCTRIVSNGGECVHLSDENRQRVLDMINSFCGEPLRVLCLAFKDMDNPHHREVSDDGYTLIAVVGIADPLRPGVKDAVQTCLDAGITMCIVTGDNISTAKAVAEKCGIFKGDEALAIEGEALRALGKEELKELIPRIQVFARCSPEDKHNVVTHLKKASRQPRSTEAAKVVLKTEK